MIYSSNNSKTQLTLENMSYNTHYINYFIFQSDTGNCEEVDMCAKSSDENHYHNNYVSLICVATCY